MMTARRSPFIPPRKILLATDLSGSSDRALDRATQLALQWGAELVVVHALDSSALADQGHQALPSWRRPPNSAALVEARIREDIRGDCPRLQVHVEEGDPASVVLKAIGDCDLVVVGLGRRRVLGSETGKTIDELFRRSPVSVLVVKRRPAGPYAHLLIGTDFTEEARFGLEVAAEAFPHATLAVMHAFDLPYKLLRVDSPLSRDFGAMERATIAAFVQEARIPDAVKSRVLTLIEHGPPEAMLSSYATERGADLTVIGAYERGWLFHTFVGGLGPRIVAAVPNDVLMVRAQPETEPSRADESGSTNGCAPGPSRPSDAGEMH